MSQAKKRRRACDVSRIAHLLVEGMTFEQVFDLAVEHGCFVRGGRTVAERAQIQMQVELRRELKEKDHTDRDGQAFRILCFDWWNEETGERARLWKNRKYASIQERAAAVELNCQQIRQNIASIREHTEDAVEVFGKQAVQAEFSFMAKSYCQDILGEDEE